MRDLTTPINSPLVFLPFRTKPVGWALLGLSSILLAAYFLMDFRFQMPVFAVVSSFFETRFLVSFRTNFADELIMIGYLAGFFILVFSRERNESPELNGIRGNAMFLAIRYNFAFLAFSVLFVYGTGFIGALLLNLVSVSILYLVIFNRLKKRRFP